MSVIDEVDAGEECLGARALQRPVGSTVCRGSDESVVADHPAVRAIGEVEAGEIAGEAGALGEPVGAAVAGGEDLAASTDEPEGSTSTMKRWPICV